MPLFEEWALTTTGSHALGPSVSRERSQQALNSLFSIAFYALLLYLFQARTRSVQVELGQQRPFQPCLL